MMMDVLFFKMPASTNSVYSLLKSCWRNKLFRLELVYTGAGIQAVNDAAGVNGFSYWIL